MALMAIASALPHHHNINGRFDQMNSKFDEKYAKFETMTAEEQIQLMDRVRPFFPQPIKEKLAGLTDEQKMKIIEKIGEYHALPAEERKQVFDKAVAKHHEMMGQNPHGFKNIPDDVRQKMKERFDALSQEEKEELKNHIHRKFSEGAVAYSAAADHVQPIRIRTPVVGSDPNFRERHPRPAPAQNEAPAYQPIRTREDDIMLRPQWNRDAPRKQRKENF